MFIVLINTSLHTYFNRILRILLKKNIGIGKISLFYANFFLTVESTKKFHVVKKIQKKLYIVSADQIPNLFIVPNRIGIS